MPRVDLVVESAAKLSTRARQLASMFELEAKPSREAWSFDLDLPEAWNVGLIVGPSGSGKSTVARHLFGDALVASTWPAEGTLVDGFPKSVGVKDVAAALSSVGFSSPPNWLRPHAVLSNGEKFRADVARALVDERRLVAIDEFTSVVDRTVAQIGSAAVGKAFRRSERQLVAIACHYDIIEWLQPDWVLHMPSGQLERRSVQRRPAIDLAIERVGPEAWDTFRRYHYLSHACSRQAQCFVATVRSRPVAFAAVMWFSHPDAPGWRGHRTVCLPDFQGVGIGNVVSESIAAAYRATGRPYRSVTSHPAMMAYRARSPLWRMFRAPGLIRSSSQRSRRQVQPKATGRLSASFEFVGAPRPDLAEAWGLVSYQPRKECRVRAKAQGARA